MAAQLVAEGAHDLHAGIIFGGVNPLARTPPQMDGLHRAVGLFVEHATQALQPVDDPRRIAHQGFHQIGHVGKTTAADGVQIMDRRGVEGLVGGLDTPLGHHGVGVAVAQFGGQQHLGAVLPGRERR